MPPTENYHRNLFFQVRKCHFSLFSKISHLSLLLFISYIGGEGSLFTVEQVPHFYRSQLYWSKNLACTADWSLLSINTCHMSFSWTIHAYRKIGFILLRELKEIMDIVFVSLSFWEKLLYSDSLNVILKIFFSLRYILSRITTLVHLVEVHCLLLVVGMTIFFIRCGIMSM